MAKGREISVRLDSTGAVPYITGGVPAGRTMRALLRFCRRFMLRSNTRRTELDLLVGRSFLAEIGDEFEMLWSTKMSGPQYADDPRDVVKATFRCIGTDDVSGEPEWKIVAVRDPDRDA